MADKRVVLAGVLALAVGCGPADPGEVDGSGETVAAQVGGIPVAPGELPPASWHPGTWMPNPGPWPTAAQLDYSSAYGLPQLKSVGIDDAHNLWLLDHSNRIGVLRADEGVVHWSSNVGQAARGFSTTVICGGAGGQAYVGYYAAEGGDQGCGDVWHRPEDPSDGDADVVQLDSDGNPALEKHLNLFNSNDHHCDETRTIYACTKVMRGPMRGDIYLGTNHAVTRVRGLDYSDHRHSVWDVDGSLRIGYNYAVGITFDGDVLLGNEWKVAMLTPQPELQSWTDFSATPWKLDTYVSEAGSLEDFDFWRATAQTKDRTDYWGSLTKGLWRMYEPGRFEKVSGLPTDDISALAGTDDGALYIGTGGGGLWRMEPDGTLGRVDSVPGRNVIQLVYDPTVEPSMLLVLTNAGLTVLRGP
jgi:hypothetical protein